MTNAPVPTEAEPEVERHTERPAERPAERQGERPAEPEFESGTRAAMLAAEPDQHFRVLLIEDDGDQMLLVKYALEDCGRGRYELSWENRLSQGKERLAKGGVDVVLLDLGLPGSSGPASYAAIRSAAPEVPIVVLTSDENEQTESCVMACGAEDYLIKEEISAPQLLRAIRSAIYRHKNRLPQTAPQPGTPAGFTIGFVGAKGGAGTTSTVLNFAAKLGPERSTIALETAVHRSGFAHQLRADAYPARTALLECEFTPQTFAEMVASTCLQAGVMFAPLAGCWGNEACVAQVREMMKLAVQQADFVLVDAGSQWDPVTQAVLAECQAIVLVVDREPGCFAAVRDWSRRFADLPGRGREISVLIVNRSGLDANSFLDKMQRSFSWPLLAVIPYAADRCAWAMERCRPLAYLDPADPVTEAISEATARFATQAASWSATA